MISFKILFLEKTKIQNDLERRKCRFWLKQHIVFCIFVSFKGFVMYSETNREYAQPQAEVILMITENWVCDSPIPGGNEGVGYENW